MDWDIFSFEVVPALGNFLFVEYQATQGLSQCFEYKVTVLADSPSLDFGILLASRGKLMIGQQPIYGEIHHVKMVRRWSDAISSSGVTYAFEYEITLVPAFINLKHHTRSKVYIDKSIPAIIDEILSKYNFSYLLALSGYTSATEDTNILRDFTFQYEQSDFEFLNYWFERLGIYYYFEHTADEDEEKLIITDVNTIHTTMPAFIGDGGAMEYVETATVDQCVGKNRVNSFSMTEQHIPSSVKVKGYNYETSTTDIEGSFPIHNGRLGELFIFDEMAETEAEAIVIAQNVGGSLSAQKRVCSSTSYARFMLPGFLFEMSGHYNPLLNAEYLVTEVVEKGSIRDALIAVHVGSGSATGVVPFQCDFKCISASTGYRPPMVTPPKRVFGVINAVIDSEGSSEYAYLDELGRYKVSIIMESEPGDLSGQNSLWVRKAEPFVGDGYGVHYPMRPGIEVMIGFEMGNPNRPYITGAVYNSEHKNPVDGTDAANSRQRSSSGHEYVVNEEHNYTVIRDGDGQTVYCQGNYEKGSKEHWHPKGPLAAMK